MKTKGSLYILFPCPPPREPKEGAPRTTGGKAKKDEDNVASLTHGSQTSKNYAFQDGTLEKYNEKNKKVLTLVWDASTDGYRDATEEEKGDPTIDKASAIKWGAYSNTDNKGNPECLIHLKTFKGAQNTSTFQLQADLEDDL